MGPFPEKLASVVEPQSDVILLLVYESDAKAQPSRFIPKEVLSKCRVVKPVEFPRWPRERQAWVTRLAGELEAPLTAQGAAMIVELLDDPEEIRAQLKSLKLLKKNGAIDAADVRQMCLDDGSRNLLRLLDGLCTGDAVGVVKSLRACLDDGSRNLLRLLDGLCTGDAVGVVKSLRAMSSSADLIPSITPIHNRMRLAWYASLGNDGAAIGRALGAKDYAWRMASQAARRSGRAALTDFISDLRRNSIEQRSGRCAGWNGLETAVIKLLARG